MPHEILRLDPYEASLALACLHAGEGEEAARIGSLMAGKGLVVPVMIVAGGR